MKNEEQDPTRRWSRLVTLVVQPIVILSFHGNHHLPMLYRSNALQVKAPKAKLSKASVFGYPYICYIPSVFNFPKDYDSKGISSAFPM